MYIFLSSELHTTPRAVSPFTITADQSPQTIVMQCGTPCVVHQTTIRKSNQQKRLVSDVELPAGAGTIL